MFDELLKLLEKRTPVGLLQERFADLFETDEPGRHVLTKSAFRQLIDRIEKGAASSRSTAAQAGVTWCSSSQKVTLRNALLKNGFLTPSCLWAFVQMRGSVNELLSDPGTPENRLMQIMLLKEGDPGTAVPYLIERYLSGIDMPDELRGAARLCVLRLLDSAGSPDLQRELQNRFPDTEILFQWRPAAPTRKVDWNGSLAAGSIDFHQLVRSVRDIREFSSLTRTLYLLSLFVVPLSRKSWQSLFLSRNDEQYFGRLMSAGVVESQNGGYAMSQDGNKQTMVRKFLYDSYSLARDSVHRHAAKRTKEQRERRVRDSELDRQALEMVPDGIVCVDKSRLFYYANRAAEHMLAECIALKTVLFGEGLPEDTIKQYSKETALAALTKASDTDGIRTEIFGNRVSVMTHGKKFELELGTHIVLMRDLTDQHLIDEEIGKLYRHEMRATLDVMGVGLTGIRDLVSAGNNEEALRYLEQVEEKRSELATMLEERIDFIRLHSDSFQIRPETVNLNMITDRCLSKNRVQAEARGITLKSNHLRSDAVFTTGEEKFLFRAIDNILRNAIRFSQDGGRITITVEESGNEASVAIGDEGPGIESKNIGKVFQLGFTTGGTGRGLYLTKRIVTAHKGRIEVKSKPGNGACFTVFLPLVTES